MRADRTKPERFRATAASPTLVAVILLLAITPGAAAVAFAESDHAGRPALKLDQRRDDAREFSSHAVATLAAAFVRVAAPTAILPQIDRTPSVAAPTLERSPTRNIVVATLPLREALLDLPPPIA